MTNASRLSRTDQPRWGSSTASTLASASRNSGLVSIAVPFVVSIGHRMSSFIFENEPNGITAMTLPSGVRAWHIDRSASTGRAMS